MHPDAATRGRPGAAVRAARAWTRDEAIVELSAAAGVVGPTTASALGASLAIDRGGRRRGAARARIRGRVLRGSLHRRRPVELEWCDRRLLARIHRYTLNRLRAEIEPVSPADFMRFLFAWQHVDAGEPAHRRRRTRDR